MKRRLIGYSLLAVALGLSSPVLAQSTLTTLWDLQKKSQPLQTTSSLWEEAGRKRIRLTCLSGDCDSGYGVAIGNMGDGSRYQYEGFFKKGRPDGLGISKYENGLIEVADNRSGQIVEGYLSNSKGIYSLINAQMGDNGFTLADIQTHFTNSFEGFTKCNCLVPATHVENEPYQKPHTVKDEYGSIKGTEYTTEYHEVEYPGFKNNCKTKVFIKAIRKYWDCKTSACYTDETIMLMPGRTMKKVNFTSTYNSKVNDVQYLGQYQNQSKINDAATSPALAIKTEKAADPKKEGEAFLANNKSKPGVVSLPSGLQYMVVREGTGPKPTLTDKVKLHYEMSLVNGKIFESSIKRGQPVELNVNGVIAGWTEALQLMPTGSKWKLFIPSNLAYGDKNAGPDIKPNSALICDVELLDVVK